MEFVHTLLLSSLPKILSKDSFEKLVVDFSSISLQGWIEALRLVIPLLTPSEDSSRNFSWEFLQKFVFRIHLETPFRKFTINIIWGWIFPLNPFHLRIPRRIPFGNFSKNPFGESSRNFCLWLIEKLLLEASPEIPSRDYFRSSCWRLLQQFIVCIPPDESSPRIRSKIPLGVATSVKFSDASKNLFSGLIQKCDPRVSVTTPKRFPEDLKNTWRSFTEETQMVLLEDSQKKKLQKDSQKDLLGGFWRNSKYITF